MNERPLSRETEPNWERVKEDKLCHVHGGVHPGAAQGREECGLAREKMYVV
jgi:hypothetical protein